MKIKLAFLALSFLVILPVLHAQVSVDFESPVYILDEGVGGITDPSTQTPWYNSGSGASIVDWQGSKALKIDVSKMNTGVSLQDVARVANFEAPPHLVQVSFDYAYGGGPSAWDASSFRIGGNLFNAEGAAWMDIRLSGHTFYLIRQSADGKSNEAIEISAEGAAYRDLVNADGDFVRITFELDTQNNTYKSLMFSGSKGTYDATPLVSSWKLPFADSSAEATSKQLIFSSMGTNSIHYIDNISVDQISMPKTQ